MIEFVAGGYIEVWLGTELISRHRVEREAIESIVAQDRDGIFELRFPTVRVIVKRRITVPDAPALGAVTVVSSSALTVPLARAATGPTRLAEYILERSLDGANYSEIARGIDIFGAGGAYADTGLAAATNYVYRAAAIDTTDRQSVWSAEVVGQTLANTTPGIPTNLAVSSTQENLSISWSAPTTGTPDSYTIERSTTGTSGWASIYTGATSSYLDTSLSVGDVRWYRVNATTDSVSGGYTSAVRGEVLAVAGNAVKWNPGHYAETQTYASIPDSVVADVAAEANLQGVIQRYNWSTIETARGVYNFSAIDADLAKLRPSGKRLIPLIMDRSWSGTSTAIFPTYLLTETSATVTHNITYKQVNAGVIANIWIAGIMDRYIALIQALIARYDDEPLLEAFSFEEITPGGASTNGYLYSNSAMITQWRRLYTAVSAVSAHTMCCSLTNTLGGVTGPLNLIEYAYQNTPMIAVGGPDIIPPGADDYQIGGDRAWMQNPDIAKGDNPALFLRDYRGTLPCREGVQTPSLGGKEGTFYPPEIAAYGCTTLQITHMSWVVAPSNVLVNWATHIYPYLQGTPLATATAFPSRLTAIGKVANTGGT